MRLHAIMLAPFRIVSGGMLCTLCRLPKYGLRISSIAKIFELFSRNGLRLSGMRGD
jgi:hypothetical protein